MVYVRELDAVPMSEQIATLTKLAFQRKSLQAADFNRNIAQFALLNPITQLYKPIQDSLAGIFQNAKNFQVNPSRGLDFSPIGLIAFVNDLDSKQISTGVTIGNALLDVSQNGAAISQIYSAYARELGTKFIAHGNAELNTQEIADIVADKSPRSTISPRSAQNSMGAIFQNASNFDGEADFSREGFIAFAEYLDDKGISTGNAIANAIVNMTVDDSLPTYSGYAKTLHDRFLKWGTKQLNHDDLVDIIEQKSLPNDPFRQLTHDFIIDMMKEERGSDLTQVLNLYQDVLDDVARQLPQPNSRNFRGIELLERASKGDTKYLKLLRGVGDKVASSVQPEGVDATGRELAGEIVAQLVENSMAPLEGIPSPVAVEARELVGSLESPRAATEFAHPAAEPTEVSIFDTDTVLSTVEGLPGTFKQVFLGSNNTYASAKPKDLWAFSPVKNEPGKLWAFGTKIDQHDFQNGMLTIPDRDVQIPVTKQFVNIMSTKVSDLDVPRIILDEETKAVFKELATKIPRLLEGRSSKLDKIKLGMAPSFGSGITLATPKEGLKRLTVLLGIIGAGNNSKKVLSEVKELGDFLMLHKQITRRDNKKIQSM